MAMRVDAAIVTVVVAFLLPLRLLSLVVRLSSAGSAGDLRRPCTAFAIAAALLAAIFALPRDHARECAASVAVADGGEEGFRREVRSEVEQLKLQLARLESFWENNSKALDAKGDALEEDGEVVKAMGLDIQSLIKEQQNIKELLRSSDSSIKSVKNEVSQLLIDCFGHTDHVHVTADRLAADMQPIRVHKDGTLMGATTAAILSYHVQILADESRKINSDVYNIWSLVSDIEIRVEALHSDFKKVQILTDESRQMNSDLHQIWSLAKDTEKRVEDLYADIKKVHIQIDESRNLESNIYKMWSFAKQTEKKVEDLYSDVKKGFKKKGMKVPSWMN